MDFSDPLKCIKCWNVRKMLQWILNRKRIEMKMIKEKENVYFHGKIIGNYAFYEFTRWLFAFW